MTGLLQRRGFLRGLVSLPLIGGGVTLIGNPTAAAVVPDEALIRQYERWLEHEKFALFVERHGGWRYVYGDHREEIQAEIDAGTAPAWRMEERATLERHLASVPSSRAAVVLAAVGEWKP